MRKSVHPDWIMDLPLQQQSVLALAARGPDGVGKFHPCKEIVRHYRACVFLAAYYGRELHLGEHADNFMSLRAFTPTGCWEEDWHPWGKACKAYFDNQDELPHHYHMHLLHGAEILGYKHPDRHVRKPWQIFYERGCMDLHMTPETEAQMNARLCDWNHEHWEKE